MEGSILDSLVQTFGLKLKSLRNLRVFVVSNVNSKLNLSENIFQSNLFSHFIIVMRCVYVSVLVLFRLPVLLFSLHLHLICLFYILILCTVGARLD